MLPWNLSEGKGGEKRVRKGVLSYVRVMVKGGGGGGGGPFFVHPEGAVLAV